LWRNAFESVRFDESAADEVPMSIRHRPDRVSMSTLIIKDEPDHWAIRGGNA
jgi:hypothetical protein